jgi:hypothetical protein
MPKRSKRTHKRRGSSAERNTNGEVGVAEKVGSDAGSQDEGGSMTNESLGETSPTGEDIPNAETVDDKISESQSQIQVEQTLPEPAVVQVVPGSPSKDDQVLDAAAASPFLTPSGVSAPKAVPDVELTFSPGSETGTVGKVMADSPGVNKTAIRESPAVAPEDDLLRQSVDLAAMGTTATPKATAVAVAEDGTITVSVEPLEIVTGQSPKTDRSGSVPLSTISPVVAYPQSPALGVVATPLSASAVIPTPLSASIVAPAKTPIAGSPIASPTLPPAVDSRTPTAVVAPTAVSPKSPPAVEESTAEAPAEVPTEAVSPPVPAVAVLENSEATLAVTPMTPSLAVPPIPIAMPSEGNPAQERSISRDRISAFISTTSPPRGTAMDSMALAQDPEMQRSIQSSSGLPNEPVPVAITQSSAGPDIPFSPIDFETAFVRLTGRTGKSIRNSSAKDSSTQTSFFGKCMTCFGKGPSGNTLAKDLLEDKNAQTTLFSTPFDSQFEIHRRMLQTVYVVLSASGANREALVGEHWKNIGFKTTDPSTELNEKGNGVFHVLCMLYLVQEIGDLVRGTSKFAEYSLGLSSAAVALAKGGNLNSLYNRHRQVTPVTCHVQCAMFKRFLEVGDVFAVVTQAQTSTGLNEIVELIPYPELVAVTSAENATAAALKASS